MFSADMLMFWENYIKKTSLWTTKVGRTMLAHVHGFTIESANKNYYTWKRQANEI